ncbi:MAG: DUF4012 domain-containing protein [Actinomycetales bacterium]|nr:DUF4012 domain-containing protein [Actinomycetales bacterium]
MTVSRPRLILGGLFIVVVGGFVFWLQAGLLYALGSLAYGGYGLQNHLSQAAAGLQAGEYPQAQAEYEAAQTSTQQLDRSVDVLHLELLGRIPGVATAVDNWKRVVTSASDITDATGGLLGLYADLSGKGGGPKIFHDGGIDLAMLKDLPDRVTVASNQLHSANTTLTSIQAEAAWARLLDMVRNKALKEMAPVQQAVESIEGIAPELPDALGANGVRRYLIAIGNQAEMRAAGGAPLTLVLVEFNQGRISIPIKGPTSTQLFPPLNAPVTWWGPGGNPFFATNPRNAPFVVTNTHPNLLFSGKEMAEAWVGGNYPPVDGVITIDLTAIAAMLDATGPVESPVYGVVDGERLGQILLIDAYAQFGQEGAAERQQANQDLLNILLERLLSGDDLVSAAQAVASTAPGRHFQAWMRSPQLEKLAVDAGAAGIVDDPGTGDWSALYTQNGNQSKVDVFQQRNVLVTVQLNDDGSAKVTQQMTVTNATPPDRPAEGTFGRIGYETTWLKAAYIMYVPDAATGYSAGYPTGFAVRPFKNHPQLGRGWVDDGFGHKMIRIVGWTAPGGQNAVTVSYDLPAGTFGSAGLGRLDYQLRALPQSLWTPSTLTVQVTAPSGWTPVPQDGQQVSGSTATVSAVQSAPVDVSIGFRP